MRVGILNVTGYAGAELARILAGHPSVQLVAVTGRSEAGRPLGEVFPHLEPLGLRIEPSIRAEVDLVFSALPHRASAEACLPFLERGVPVVDLSADFRLKSAAEFEEWYGTPHPCPQHLEKAVYGLTELHRQEVASASLVANPGCYATAALLALAPAVRAGIIYPDIVVDAKSGVSGAGRSLSLTTHFSEVNESVKAYGLEGHRHLPEITRELSQLTEGWEPRVTFVPHLIPVTRGILCTCYAPLKDGALPPGERGLEELRALYREAYQGSPFVRLATAPPATKHTLGNNLCLLYPTLDRRAGRLVVVSVLDNLVKGAAGQAVQNMNLMLGLPETAGLGGLALYP